MLLLALTALAFSPVLFADFIRLDDHSHLFNNPHLHRKPLDGLVDFWTKPYFNLYIPITYSVWWFLTLVGGLTRQSAWLFHALNLTIHLVNTALVFWLVRTLLRAPQESAPQGTDKSRWRSRALPGGAETREGMETLPGFPYKRWRSRALPGGAETPPTGARANTPHPCPTRFARPSREGMETLPGFPYQIALLAAFVFALHPLQVESVAWVSELKGVLSMMFGLLGLLAHCRSGKRVASAGFFLAAMLAKPSAMVFPGMAFLLDRIVFGKSLRQSALMPAIYGVLLLPFVFWTKALQPDLNLDFIPSLGQRLVVSADALAFYLVKVLLPYPLVVDYGRTPKFVLDHVSGWQIALAALVFLAGLAVVGKAVLRPSATPSAKTPWLPLILCGWSMFLLSIAPVLGLVPFGFQQFSTVADHYLYIPLLGISLVVAGLLLRVRGFVHAPRLAMVLLGLYAGLSFVQSRHWRSTETLFTRTLQTNPQSYLGAFSIGDEYLRGGHPEQSLPWLQKSLALNPDYLEAQISLGMAWVQTGNIHTAIDHYNAAIARNPSTLGSRARSVASLHNNLGMLLLQAGREDEAVEHFRTAIRISPRALNARLNLGNVAMAHGRYRDAIAEFEKAQEVNPGNPAIEQRLGLARRAWQEAQQGQSP